jgi:hypothetical protein
MAGEISKTLCLEHSLINLPLIKPRIRIRNSVPSQNLFKIENNFCSFAIAMAMSPSQKLLFY